MDRAVFFSPLTLGSLKLQHRIVLAPLTRLRASDDLVPCDKALEYYTQRATPGGLLITEATPISPETPFAWAPGIFTDAQEKAWKRIANGVHDKGGLISMQLWHIGSWAHPSWSELPIIKSFNGKPGVSASAVPIPIGAVPEYPSMQQVPQAIPRPLEAREIPRVVNDYRDAATRAKRGKCLFCILPMLLSFI